MIQSEAATRIASFAIGSARERKKEGILCSFVWVFAWCYISSVVSPARRDIFVKSHGTDSYCGGPDNSRSSSSSSSSSSSNSSSSSSSNSSSSSSICLCSISISFIIITFRALRRVPGPVRGRNLLAPAGVDEPCHFINRMII